MVYYLILGYKKETDEQYKGHIHPSYLTSYNLKVGGSQFGLQSGIYDALKFESVECAEDFLEYAKEKFGDTYYFEIAPFPEEMFGRQKLSYVIPFDYKNDYYYIIVAYGKDDNFMNFVCENKAIKSYIFDSLKFTKKEDAQKMMDTLTNDLYDFLIVPYNKKYFGKQVPENVI